MKKYKLSNEEINFDEKQQFILALFHQLFPIVYKTVHENLQFLFDTTSLEQASFDKNDVDDEELVQYNFINDECDKRLPKYCGILIDQSYSIAEMNNIKPNKLEYYDEVRQTLAMEFSTFISMKIKDGKGIINRTIKLMENMKNEWHEGKNNLNDFIRDLTISMIFNILAFKSAIELNKNIDEITDEDIQNFSNYGFDIDYYALPRYSLLNRTRESIEKEGLSEYNLAVYIATLNKDPFSVNVFFNILKYAGDHDKTLESIFVDIFGVEKLIKDEKSRLVASSLDKKANHEISITTDINILNKYLNQVKQVAEFYGIENTSTIEAISWKINQIQSGKYVPKNYDGQAQSENIFSPKKIIAYIKKVLTVIIAIAIISVIVNVVFGNSDEGKNDATISKEDLISDLEKNAEKENEKDEFEVIDLNDYNNTIAYAMMNGAWKYAANNNIPLYDFFERKQILEMGNVNNLANILNNCTNVEEKTGFFSDTVSYKKTIEYSDYYYYGNFNEDSQPNGLGILFKYDSYYDHYFLMYIGNFEDGSFNGYGMKSEMNVLQGMDYTVWITLATDPLIVISDDTYEGYFKDGVKNGKGNNALRSVDETNYIIDIGEFADDTWNGEMKEYIYGILAYDGKTRNGNYHGYGTEYFLDTGKIKYQGEFYDGVYQGKGVLYDENGKVLHDGEFVDGNVK